MKVGAFFWNVICNSDECKEDLVNSCITKFCEMIKYWELARKVQYFNDLTQNLQEEKSSIVSIKLFKQMIKDQKDRGSTSYSSHTGYVGYGYMGSYP